MHAGTQQWNLDLLHHLLSPADVARVRQVPLIDCVVEDKLVWAFTPNGVYTVKSGYRTCCDKIAPKPHLKVEGDWNALWALKVAPRVKACVWRACRDVLPTRTRIQTRGVPCPSFCLFCPNEFENSFHLFFTCARAEQCWRHLQLWHTIEPLILQADGFWDLFFKAVKAMDHDQVCLLAVGIWSLWKSRNEMLWDDKDMRPSLVAARVLSFCKEWSFYNSRLHIGHAVHTPHCVAAPPQSWSKPPAGFVKINIDAGFNFDT